MNSERGWRNGPEDKNLDLVDQIWQGILAHPLSKFLFLSVGINHIILSINNKALVQYSRKERDIIYSQRTVPHTFRMDLPDMKEKREMRGIEYHHMRK